ncbi:unnamed protein product [Gongylonema pulchrum]|uniref:Uncharacterized protein n=1 Tax=Gongylonema pulchrum TaxID=637853 RepID=A0A183D5Y8_9BILA|nr:unnamed protein product [Gongylonema pulchrum]
MGNDYEQLGPSRSPAAAPLPPPQAAAPLQQPPLVEHTAIETTEAAGKPSTKASDKTAPGQAQPQKGAAVKGKAGVSLQINCF